MTIRLLVAALLAGVGGQAQAVRIYSEFQRIDPFGNIVGADRAERPREILSPALARNAFASFHVVVSLPEGAAHHLFIGQNPDNAIAVTMYGEQWVRRGDAWIPDGLAPLKLSDNGQVPELPPQVPGQKVTVYWMDLWARKDAPVRRTRLEVQLSIGDRWVIYPLELRFTSPVVPALNGPLEALAPIDAPASQSAVAPLRAYICGSAAAGEDGPLTVRKLIRRNARQDIALARSLEAKLGKLAFVTEVLDSLGAADRKAWCESPSAPAGVGAEWYLRARDRIHRLAGTPTLSELPKPTITVKPLN